MARIGTHVRYGDWSNHSTQQVFLSNGNANYAIKKIDKDFFREFLGKSNTLHVHAPYCINLAVDPSSVCEEKEDLSQKITDLSIEEKRLRKGLEDGTIPKRGNTGLLKKVEISIRKIQKEIKNQEKACARVIVDEKNVKKSYTSLRDVLIQIDGLPAATVFHFGSRGSIKNVAKKVMELAKEGILKPGCDRVPIKLLGEVSAGQGTSVGKTWEELQEFYSNVDCNLVGLCLDTAHLFGAGMCDFRDRGAIDELFAKCDSLGARVGLIHLNDSSTTFCSKRDKHYPHLFGNIWTANTYWYFLSVCHTRKIDVVTESSPRMDYPIMNTIQAALPYVPSPEECHLILSNFTLGNPDTLIHYQALNGKKELIQDNDIEMIEGGEMEE